MFGVFVVSSIKGATVVDLGIGHAIFMVGVLLTEPFISKIYDSALDITTSYYGFILGNLFKSIFRFGFIFLNSVTLFYIFYFLLGIVHSIEYPSFIKLFTKHMDKGLESSEWGIKDSFISLGKVITFFVSGIIAVKLGYGYLFALSGLIMLVSGVFLPLVYRKDFIS